MLFLQPLNMAFKATGARTHVLAVAKIRWVRIRKGFGVNASLPPSWRIKGQTRRGLGDQVQMGNPSLERFSNLARLSDPVLLNPKARPLQTSDGEREKVCER